MMRQAHTLKYNKNLIRQWKGNLRENDQCYDSDRETSNNFGGIDKTRRQYSYFKEQSNEIKKRITSLNH